MVVYLMHHPTSEKMYVGVAKNLRKRAKAHISEAKTRKLKLKRYAWICSLLKRGLSPYFQVLEKADTYDEIYRLEQEWIKRIKIEKEINLLNLTVGGKGTIGHVTPKWFREQNSERMNDPVRSAHVYEAMRKGHKEWAKNIPIKYKRNTSLRLIGNKFRVGIEPANKGKRSLTEEQVVEIQSKLKSGSIGVSLAREFNTSTAAISQIKNGKYFNVGWGNAKSANSWKKK